MGVRILICHLKTAGLIVFKEPHLWSQEACVFIK